MIVEYRTPVTESLRDSRSDLVTRQSTGSEHLPDGSYRQHGS